MQGVVVVDVVGLIRGVPWCKTRGRGFVVGVSERSEVVKGKGASGGGGWMVVKQEVEKRLGMMVNVVNEGQKFDPVLF